MNPIWRAYWIWLIGLVSGFVLVLLWQYDHGTLFRAIMMVIGIGGLLIAQVVQSWEKEP